jgi:hypothetical protein
LVGERTVARYFDVEGRARTNHDRGVLRLYNKLNGLADGKYRRRAGHTVEKSRYYDIVTAGITELDIGDSQC